MLRRVVQWVVPHMDMSNGGFWIIDDTGFPKKGNHSVGVMRLYCCVLGKQDNCQVASVSLACEEGSFQLHGNSTSPFLCRGCAAQEQIRRARGS